MLNLTHTARAGRCGLRLGRLLRRDERGMAMPMVIGVFLVGFALIGVFFVSLFGSAKVAATTKASIQAQAAADAGIAAQVASIGESGNPCTAAGVTSMVEPRYLVTVDASNCMSPSNPSVTFESVGTAGNGGEATVQATYAVEPAASPTITPMDTVGFYIGSVNRAFNGMKFTSAIDPAPSFVVASGDFECTGGGTKIPGDLYVANGNAKLNNDCLLSGDLYVRGNVNDTTGGNKAFNSIHATGTVTLNHNLGISSARGSLYAGGTVTVGNVPVVLDSIYSGAGIVVNSNSMNVSGRLEAVGSITGSGAGSSPLTGKKFPNSATTPKNRVPDPTDLPGWVDYGFDRSVWESAGYTYEKWTAGSTNCTKAADLWGNATFWQGIASRTASSVIDTTACTGQIGVSGSLALKSNLALIVKNATMPWGATSLSGSGAGEKQFSIVTPDANLTNGVADCPSGGGRVVFQGTTVTTSVKVNVYTPCGVTISAGSLRAGVFTKDLDDGGSGGTLDITTITLPGATFGGVTGSVSEGGGGSATPTIKGGLMAAPISQRDLG